MSLYTQYYRRTITEYQTGLKLVLGGTGLGKTSSLAALIKSGEYPADVKFIYVANRIQLLREMAEQIENKRWYIQQQKDADQLALVLDNRSLQEFLHHELTPKLLAEYRRLEHLPATSLNELHNKIERFDRARHMGAQGAGLIDLGDLASDTLKPLKGLLSLARQLAISTPQLRQELDQRQAQTLADLPVWPQLFPYIHFQADDECRLLLLTVHKGFHGVFDGQRTMRLGRWERQSGWRYVFVFDEFDFLENDLLDLLAHDREVRDPFGLVQTFYERLCQRKLTHPHYLTRRPEWQPVKQMMLDIRDRIDSLQSKHSIKFPEITHFVTDEPELQGRAIFQSNRSLVNRNVFLAPDAPRPNSFTLTADKKEGGHNAFVLFDVVTRVVKDIIRLFKRLQAEHEDIYFEVLRQCFGGTDYLQEIRQVNQIGAQHELCETNYGNLLTNGFGLYEIETGRSQLTDPDEVALLYLSLNDSPEAMIRALAQRHLVFGLSATAHIRRVLRNFDWSGLEHAAAPGTSFAPIPNTRDDEDDVRHANSCKAKRRQNTITYDVVKPLSSNTRFGEQLSGMAHADPTHFGHQNGALPHRLRRVQHFFGLLTRLAALEPDELADSQSHLVFLSSVKQVKRLLDLGGDEDGWYGAVARQNAAGDKNLQMYDVWCYDETRQRRVSCAVALYDAQFGQELRDDLALQQQYNALFWTGQPVVVLTTYPSAGNGVNLQYYQTPADYETNNNNGKRDFRFLHLLEAPYFYFGGVRQTETAAEQHAIIKRDVYGVMKLLFAKQITVGQAKGLLGQIRNLHLFNSQYLRTEDGILNQFGVYVQALGRIERVWQRMQPQKLLLDRQVYGAFEQVAIAPDLAAERENYLRYASGNMATLLQAIGEEATRERIALEDELHDLRRDNDAARAAIHQMVLDLEQFKLYRQPSDARQRWEWLRADVLRHDFSRAVISDEELPERGRPSQLRRIRGTFRSEYVHEGRLLINHELHLAPHDTRSSEFAPWDLNSVYRVFNNHLSSALATHFRVRGYEMAFVESGTYLLPYVYQSILVGAVGEEVIEAVLKSYAHIRATSAAVPDELFEVADLKVDGRPIYIDCKNFGARTLRQFALEADDLLYHLKLNEEHFKERMVSKWKSLNQHTHSTGTDPCRLIVMNLFHDEASKLDFYNEHFEPVSDWAQARIAVLTGTLNPHSTDNSDLLTKSCETLLALL
ncbi:hypothetical protein [Hymenobacter sp. CRA2]|uniref:hypothetical protein n=1 Tax=Hymenobacter sp. CRA2 TaxID=1955620 RepID=UPI00098F0D5A|nr:hypothetical protein [Hymenobacter sp. CRA2]OON65470.1 hypothetical protein B0919_24125 [Hymenobacter sp. CRA2]